MSLTLPLQDLLEVTSCAGITVERSERENANLYAWVSTDREQVLYIGKAASKRRIEEENGWKEKSDHNTGLHSAIVPLLRTQEGRNVPLRVDPDSFDRSAVPKIIERYEWKGTAIDTALKELPSIHMDSEMVEKVLIRIAVRMGRLIGNSQFASQWETPIGKTYDTVAHFAIHGANDKGLL